MAGFFDASGRAAKFDQVGASVTGRVINWREEQTKVFGTDELAVWQDGSPRMQAVITLEVDDLDGDDDNGVRSLYIASTRQKRALIDALRKGGSKVPEEGGTLTMTYSGDDANSKNPRQPAKMYTATWKKPDAAEPRSQVFGTGQSPQAAQAPAAAPAEDPWAPAQADVLTTEQRSKLAQLDAIGGLDDSTVAAALGVQVSVLQQARGVELV